MLREERDQLVVQNLPLVGYLVNDLWARATHLSRDDLASAGALALVTAAESFDEGQGVPFGAYARRRILGAFSDELRSIDWASRGTRKRIRETLAAEETLTATLGRAPSIAELADTLGLDREAAAEAKADATRTVGPLDEIVADRLAAVVPDPGAELQDAEQGAFIRASVEALPDRMRYIVTAIFFEERTVGDIADELAITHSAVSQQRSEAMRLLRDAFERHYAEERAAETVHATIAPARRSAYLARVAEFAEAGMAAVRRPRASGFDSDRLVAG